MNRKKTENDSKNGAPSQGGLKGTIDPQVWQSLRELEAASSPGLLQSLITLFLGQADEKLAVLKKAYPKGDHETVRATAHTLKSAAGNLGAMRFSSLCADIEATGREKKPLAMEMLNALETEHGRVRQALEAELTAIASKPAA